MNDIIIYFTGAINTLFHYVDSTFTDDPNMKLAFFLVVAGLSAITLIGCFLCVRCAISALFNAIFKE